MISEGRLKVAMALADPLDYESFVAACNAAGVAPLPLGQYAQQIGVALVGQRLLPEATPEDAYLSVIGAMNAAYQPNVDPAPSRGLGDTLAKITHATGLDKLAEAYTAVTGRPCNCAARQEKLNAILPYGGGK